MIFNDLPQYMFYFDQHLPRALSEGVTSTDSISNLMALFARVGPGTLDVMEIMGGQGLCTRIAVRRRLHVG